MDDLSTLSYIYDSTSSSEESDCNKSETNESDREEVYVQQGKYDPSAVVAEDRKLLNWNRWVDYRKKQQDRMKSSLKRDTHSLVMHSDDVHEKRRNAQLIEYAYEYVKFDKYRGDPKFWKLPDYIYDKCNKECVVNCPVQDKYDRTVVEKNDPPSLEYIGIPRLIKNEKGLIVPEDIPAKKKSHKCNYLNERKSELSYNVCLIEKYVPDMDNLFVVGDPIVPIDSLPAVSVEDSSAEIPVVIEAVNEPDVELYTSKDRRFPIIKIQDKIVNKTVMNQLKGDLEQVVSFSNCDMNQMYSEKIIIENIGNICVRYNWQKIDRYINPEIPLYYSTNLVKRFFFPTKSSIIPPGQITEIQFIFKSREPGVYHETWKLVFDPKFSPTKSIKFSLQGFVRASISRDELLNVEAYIKRCQVTSLSMGLLDEVMVDSQLKKPVSYESRFMYKDVFLHNNPHYFYKFETVEKLYELHKNVTKDDEWDFSIVKLRNDILNCGGSMEDQRIHLEELYKLTNELLKKHIDLDIDNEKHRSVYQLLCSFFNAFENEAEQLRSVYRIREFKNSQDSITTLKERLSVVETKHSVKGGSRSSRLSETSAKDKPFKSGSGLLKKQTSNTSNMSNSSNVKKLDTLSETLSDMASDKLTEQYVKTLSVKVRHHLSTCIDEITAMLETLDMFVKPR